MAAQAARFLIQADILPGLAAPLWDTSGIVPNDSAVGSLLHGLVGYEAQPAGMQVVFYTLVLAAIAVGMAWSRRRTVSTP
jgi:high-affinity iron transporter